jgi:hypothetical protein
MITQGIVDELATISSQITRRLRVAQFVDLLLAQESVGVSAKHYGASLVELTVCEK